MAIQPLVLVVAARNSEHEILIRSVQAEMCRAADAASLPQAIAQMSNEVALVLCSFRIGAARGLELMTCWHAERPDTPFLFVIDANDAHAAGDVIKAGASGYVREPVDVDELRAWIRKCLKNWRTGNEFRELQVRLNKQLGFEGLVAQSKPMRELVDQARAAAQVDTPALIIGEPGSGKTLFAETIHQNGPHRAEPFVAFHVPASPSRLVERELFGQAGGVVPEAKPRPSRFEAAAGGTFFIDDVADLAAVTQSRFLRILDHRHRPAHANGSAPPSSPRMIAGTARKLDVLAAEGRFSGNLLRHIGAIQLRLPPLRERREDIRLLVDHLLKRTCEALSRPVPALEPELMRFLERFDWPANVRQLNDALETMVALSQHDVLSLEDLPASLDDPTCGATGMYFPAGTSLPELERAAVEQALAHCGGNRTRAAQRLGISVRTLQRKLKSWSVEAGEHSPTGPSAEMM